MYSGATYARPVRAGGVGGGDYTRISVQSTARAGGFRRGFSSKAVMLGMKYYTAQKAVFWDRKPPGSSGYANLVRIQKNLEVYGPENQLFCAVIP